MLVPQVKAAVTLLHCWFGETVQDRNTSSTNYLLCAESIVDMYKTQEHKQFNKNFLYYQQMITRSLNLTNFSHREYHQISKSTQQKSTEITNTTTIYSYRPANLRFVSRTLRFAKRTFRFDRRTLSRL